MHLVLPQFLTIHGLELTEQCPAAKLYLPWVDEVLKIHLNMQLMAREGRVIILMAKTFLKNIPLL